MMQVKIENVGDTLLLNTFYLDIYDKMTIDSGRVLMTLTSQFTGKSKTVSLNTIYTNKERYVSLSFYTTRMLNLEDLLEAKIQLGTKEFPMGFYDAILYQNADDNNLDTTGLPVIWNGLMNIAGNTNSTESVTYTEYANNDSENDSVYITAVANN